jgi:hypothetical protein
MMAPAIGGFGQSEVNIGWYGARTVRDTALCRAPGGTQVVAVRNGRRVGRQSVPNPSLSPTPAMRESRDGHGWFYEVMSGKAGWLHLEDVEHDDAVDLSRENEDLCGPADVDFQVNRTTPRGHHGPDARPRTKQGEYSVKFEDAMLRLAPHGSAFEWVEKGDLLTATAVVDMGKELDYFVTVKESATAPVGTHGYIVGLALKRLTT